VEGHAESLLLCGRFCLTGISLLGATFFAGQPASAQPSLSLSQAIARAKARNPDAESAAAAEREAAERVTQVRGGYFPKVDVAESWQRGNQPVFVFSSLLAQRQFTTAGFALDALNHPATDNFRAAVRSSNPVRSHHLGECSAASIG
jgi:outer membrane protein TolC